MACEKFVASAVVAAATMNVAGAVEALVGLASSVKHCKDKCTALAVKVKDIHNCALCRVQQQRGHFEDAELGPALTKFEVVVKDATDLVHRYKNCSILTKLLLTLNLEDDFDSLDARLDACMKLFALGIHVHYTLSLAHLQEAQAAFNHDIQEQFAACMKTVQDIKRLVGSPHDHSSVAEIHQDPPTLAIHIDKELYGGYMLTGRMQQEQQEHFLDVLLIASAQLDLHQAAIMKRLSFNANILHYFGKHVADGGCLYAVMERPALTTSSPMTLDIFISKHPTLRCDWRLKKMIVLELALAIAFAHSAQVLHRTLRSPDIFLTDDLHPKIYGFFQKTRLEYNEKCDIFSLGVIMWELIAWSYPYSDCRKDLQVIVARTNHGRKLEFRFTDSCSETLQEFLHICLECMDLDSDKRPGIDSVVSRISGLAPEAMHMASSELPLEDIGIDSVVSRISGLAPEAMHMASSELPLEDIGKTE